MRRRFPARLGAALFLLPALALGGCASPGASGAHETSHGAEAGTGANGGTTDETSSGVELLDGWAKSAPSGGMTGLFGVLENRGDHDLVIASAESPDAGSVELHEVTADGVMQEIAEPVTIPAGGSFELAPGANHLMLLDLQRDLLAGDETTVTLRFSDGTEVELTALVKDYAGANEEYGDDSHGDGHDHDHGDGHDAH
ncbi:copper chaperone PCu(A)C [Leucobacter soli]|uniref:Copper chaperone PCu(A)C n=1 Tax=Leucobacter soli TaxID=2812850 RepID=A0A916NKK5_9MICO|nr:copper chaperone PCu(A)C [Leucobacter soli]CAG7598262.1 hypothetical protein LEUCIP111803_00208 [Leucobacter soli]